MNQRYKQVARASRPCLELWCTGGTPVLQSECDMLRRLNPRLELLTALINAADDPVEKVRLAGELEQEVNVLLDCANHQAGQPECRNCRLIAGLRSRAAQLVGRAGQLSRTRPASPRPLGERGREMVR